MKQDEQEDLKKKEKQKENDDELYEKIKEYLKGLNIIDDKNVENQVEQFKAKTNSIKKKLDKYLKEAQQPENNNKKYSLLMGLLLGLGMYMILNEKGMIQIEQEQFWKDLLSDQIVKIDIVTMSYLFGQNKVVGQMTYNDSRIKVMNLGNVDHFLKLVETKQTEQGKSPADFVRIQFKAGIGSDRRYEQVHRALLIVINVLTLFFFMNTAKASLGSFAKNKKDSFGMNVKSQFKQNKIQKITFKDVAGQEEAKQEIMEFVEFLKKPKKFKQIGARIPRGALLSGPPGTGKTLLAKAIAGEAGVPFYDASGSQFVEMFVGLGSSRVRELFQQAQENSPSIIFIDEIDAIGKKRSGQGGNDERDSTLNQLLVEMDGFNTDNTVIVLAATNRKEMLDTALTRPGRFDRQIEVQLPDIQGRKEIFEIYLKKLKLDPKYPMDQYSRRLATLTPGFSGAEISNLCNEAAIHAARNQKQYVDSYDFEVSSERVLAGLQKKSIQSKEDRQVVSVHESGHAVVSWYLEGNMPLLKLTIIPRSKGSLGFAQYLPSETMLNTKEELIDQLAQILGGRCAEQLFFNQITTGAYDDLQKAQRMAYNMVTKYGMSDKIGYLGFKDDEYIKKNSDWTQQVIDSEIKNLITLATDKAIHIIEDKKDQIYRLSDALLEKETLDLKQITAILGPRPFEPRSNFKEYLEVKQEIEQEQKQDQINDQ